MSIKDIEAIADEITHNNNSTESITEKSSNSKLANKLANLKPPWKKGDPSPNPNGAPKTKIFREAFISKMKEAMANSDKTILQALVDKAVSEALKGKIDFLTLIVERIDGRILKHEEDETPPSLTLQGGNNLFLLGPAPAKQIKE